MMQRGLYNSYDWWCIRRRLCWQGGVLHRREDCQHYHDDNAPTDGLCWQGGMLHRLDDCQHVHPGWDRHGRRVRANAAQN